MLHLSFDLDRLIETVKVIKEAELSPVHAYHDFNNFTIDNEGAFYALTNLSFHKGKLRELLWIQVIL